LKQTTTTITISQSVSWHRQLQQQQQAQQKKKTFLQSILDEESGGGGGGGSQAGKEDHTIVVTDQTWLYQKQFITKGNLKILFYAGNKEDGLSGANLSRKQVSDYVLKKRYSVIWPSLSQYFFLLKTHNELRPAAPETKTIIDLETALELFGNPTARTQLLKRLKTAVLELVQQWNDKQESSVASENPTVASIQFDVSFICTNYINKQFTFFILLLFFT